MIPKVTVLGVALSNGCPATFTALNPQTRAAITRRAENLFIGLCIQMFVNTEVRASTVPNSYISGGDWQAGGALRRLEALKHEVRREARGNSLKLGVSSRSKRSNPRIWSEGPFKSFRKLTCALSGRSRQLVHNY